ncbi:phosphatidylinositol 4-phosphate 5-kinase 4-like [Nylanderia fulva]|uniref:phosphatidylinositol 4-phosphate 5-kinase 4-like n=1 Tax=Nylanderia fulva TaxID=613905 RepID=UPI0010FAEA3C|nr:phosphatidylinositol 4-phosphate 5-kinase 4-like [Nylanderia fulva]
MKALQEEILRKCRKKAEFLAPRDDETKNEEHEVKDLHEKEDALSMETDKITEEDLPFEDVLAEKRRKCTAKEEFIYSIWDGYFLRKKSFAKKSNKDDAEAIEEREEIDDKGDDLFIKEDEEKKDELSIPSWKLSLPDEFAEIKFYNKNSYCGRISQKMMEGEGTYRWHNGVYYKGQFERNKMQGRGFLEWNNNCWHEGEFMDGFRHGKGLIIDREKSRMHIGQWHMGHRKKIIK